MTPATFLVRPCLDGSGRPLVEFRGDHGAAGYPVVLDLLERTPPGSGARGEAPGWTTSCGHAGSTAASPR